MKTNIKSLYFVLGTIVLIAMSSCEPRALTKEDVLVMGNDQLLQELKAENPNGEYTIYNLNDLLDTYMTEKGNFQSDDTQYRTRSLYKGLYLFSIDTLPVNGPGIYIRGRIATDDYGGNFYKSLVLQQIVDGNQQNLRISVDMGSAGGLYQQGQEILIRCNGMAIGRYANQPQLCVPTNNNNIFASSAKEKVGWAPGRIPSAQFRNATRLIGEPDQSKLVYETMTLESLYDNYLVKYNDVTGARKRDGLLVKVIDVHFTGEYDELNVGPAQCNRYAGDATLTDGNPELDKNAYTI